MNPNGEKILNLAIFHDMAVCSTFFEKGKSKKVTCVSRARRKEVGHILVRSSVLKTVRDVKVLLEKHVVSQHRSPGGRSDHTST